VDLRGLAASGHPSGGEPGPGRHRRRHDPGRTVRPAVPGRTAGHHLEGNSMSETVQSSDRKVMIQLEGLTKRYPGQETNAVDNLDLEIYEGEIVVLVGPSGCGKTTTMKMINRIIEPTEGRIIMAGEDVTKTNPD